ncbi:MAG: hypothetical protein COA79_18090 [Planctomycetota bacterium]|nr:MAG: hypothetical protein COA79_18090 [Planctomycetota bacterium]
MKINNLFLLIALLISTKVLSAFSDSDAKRFIKSINRSKGMAIVLNDYNCALTFAKNSNFYIHLVTGKGGNSQKKRFEIGKLKLECQISIVENETPKLLPYTDNLVNVIFILNNSSTKLSGSEIYRVCSPGGYIVIAKNNIALIEELNALESNVTSLGSNKIFKKKVPESFDEWNHIKGAANQSFVIDDSEVGPWKETRWIGDPKWGSLYTSYSGFVTGGGRIYYKEFVDTHNGGRWFIICRDAYNGVELWRSEAGSRERYIRTPDYTICCDKNNLYYRDGLNLISKHGQSGKMINKYKTKSPPIFAMSIQNILIVADRGLMTAFNKKSAKKLWQTKISSFPAAEGRMVFYQEGKNMYALYINSGKKKWEFDLSNVLKTLRDKMRIFAKGDMVYAMSYQKYSSAKILLAIDGISGKEKWRETGKWGYATIPYNDEVWMIDRNNKLKKESLKIKLINSKNGKVKDEYRVPGHVYGKCFTTKATANYFLYSNGWYYNKKLKKGYENNSTRSPCRIGQHPGNGMTYFLPHHCACQVTFRGFLALAKRSQIPWKANIKDNNSLKIGTGKGVELKDLKSDWPMYKKDHKRSNFTKSIIAGKLIKSWTKKVASSKLSQATTSYNKVFVSDERGDKIIALDQKTGNIKWEFFTTGTPRNSPTLYKGYCLIGTGGGYVHCLNAKTGKEIWTRRVAPCQKYIGDRGKFDSEWPVAGSVLIKENSAFISVGRSAKQLHGLNNYALNIKTGKIKWHYQEKGHFSADMFLSDKISLVFNGLRYDFNSGKRVYGKAKSVSLKGILKTTRYLTPVSIVDYSNSIKPAQTDKRHEYLSDGIQQGDILASTPDTSICAGRYSNGYGKTEWRKIHGRLFLKAKGKYNWALKNMDMQIYGLATAVDKIYAIGISKEIESKNKSELRVYQLNDGKMIQKIEIDGTPIYDSLSIANGRLYVTTTNGIILCYSGS